MFIKRQKPYTCVNVTIKAVYRILKGSKKGKLNNQNRKIMYSNEFE